MIVVIAPIIAGAFAAAFLIAHSLSLVFSTSLDIKDVVSLKGTCRF